MNDRTAELIAWDRQYVWHPFTPMKAWVENKDILVIERGEREFLIDTEGRRYIDGVSSIWCNVHGHCVPELDEAVRAQLAKVAHTSLLGLASVPSVLLARRLVELVRADGLDLAKVFFSDDGSTAVEVACKMAYQYWANRGEAGRTRFLALDEAYHGDTVGAVSVGGIPTFHAAFRGLCFPVDRVAAPVRVPTRSPELATPPSLLGAEEARRIEVFAAALEAHLAKAARYGGGRYAAIVVEPLVQGAGGMIMHPPGTLRRIRQIADKYGVLLICDEVMTGFGRTGRMFACTHEGVTPDLLCLSKGITAGYMPLGVTLATQRVYDAFYDDPRAGKTFYHGHTFTGHPLACAVALASLDLFEKRDLLGQVARLGPMIDEILAPLTRHPNVADVRRLGLIAAVDLVRDKATGRNFPHSWRVGGALCTRMRNLGMLMRPLADVIVIMPPLAIAQENLRALCAAVVESAQWIPEVIAAKRREFGE
jgi:adenosylmethionine-8-amino-7-oxononanoate aminotransferase